MTNRECAALRAGPGPHLHGFAPDLRFKFMAALLAAAAWFGFSTVLALPWIRDLAEFTGWAIALFVIGGIALVPGYMNAYLAASLLLDRGSALGRMWIDSTAGKSVRAELRGERTMWNDASLSFSVLYTNSSERAGSNDGNYWWHSAGATLVIPF